jgi:glycosyltransferase involved in cell wall biosynthesis
VKVEANGTNLMKRDNPEDIVGQGALDNLNIFRFAQAFEKGGGIERYLEELDLALLARNKVRIFRMYLSEKPPGNKEEINLGRGTLIKIALEAERNKSPNLQKRDHGTAKLVRFIKRFSSDHIIYNPVLYRAFFRKALSKYFPRTRQVEAKNAGAETDRILRENKIDLFILHYVGGRDSAAIIERAKERNIPYIVLNHFSNELFSDISTRETLGEASGIAGVTGIGVPKWLRSRFTNLSDGIDTVVFSPTDDVRQNLVEDTPIVIYPARIIREKGQSDLIRSYAVLKQKGVRAKVLIIGRTDSISYAEELRRVASQLGVEDNVEIVEQMNAEALREIYRRSAILGFPTYHNEGLPRILLEAQAMCVPPIAYNAGGLSEGIQHGVTGFVVPRGDIRTFTNYLGLLLENRDLRSQMGRKGREFIMARYSTRALVNRHEKYYLGVIRNPVS